MLRTPFGGSAEGAVHKSVGGLEIAGRFKQRGDVRRAHCGCHSGIGAQSGNEVGATARSGIEGAADCILGGGAAKHG